MYHPLNDVSFVQYKNDKWASAQRKFNNPRICFCAAKREKLIPRNIYSILLRDMFGKTSWYMNVFENERHIFLSYKKCHLVPFAKVGQKYFLDNYNWDIF